MPSMIFFATHQTVGDTAAYGQAYKHSSLQTGRTDREAWKTDTCGARPAQWGSFQSLVTVTPQAFGKHSAARDSNTIGLWNTRLEITVLKHYVLFTTL